MKIVNPDGADTALSEEAQAAIAHLAVRQRKASGVLMKVISFAGSQVEDGMNMLPVPVRAQLDKAAKSALERSYHAAHRSRAGTLADRVTGDRAHKVLSSISGALGGLGGLPTALAELPIATTVIFRAVQGVAAEYGEDPDSDETRVECLRVFGSGGPNGDDDAVDTTFIGARVSLTGPAINKLINAIAPRFAAILGQKLASQAVPILGAAAGAGTNYAFTGYYVEMAHVHFGLRKWAREHGDAAVADHFHAALGTSPAPINKA